MPLCPLWYLLGFLCSSVQSVIACENKNGRVHDINRANQVAMGSALVLLNPPTHVAYLKRCRLGFREKLNYCLADFLFQRSHLWEDLRKMMNQWSVPNLDKNHKITQNIAYIWEATKWCLIYSQSCYRCEWCVITMCRGGNSKFDFRMWCMKTKGTKMEPFITFTSNTFVLVWSMLNVHYWWKLIAAIVRC
jgi:hypothetical protein